MYFYFLERGIKRLIYYTFITFATLKKTQKLLTFKNLMLIVRLSFFCFCFICKDRLSNPLICLPILIPWMINKKTQSKSQLPGWINVPGEPQRRPYQTIDVSSKSSKEIRLPTIFAASNKADPNGDTHRHCPIYNYLFKCLGILQLLLLSISLTMCRLRRRLFRLTSHGVSYIYVILVALSLKIQPSYLSAARLKFSMHSVVALLRKVLGNQTPCVCMCQHYQFYNTIFFCLVAILPDQC